MMLESTKKLREWRNVPDDGYWADEIIEHADTIESEIAEHYIERDKAIEAPLGADGVPIRYGDKLRSDELPGREFTCLGFNVTLLGGEPLWLIEWRYDGDSGTSEYVSAKSCRHVKPDSLEELLTEMLDRNSDGVGLREFNCDFDAFIAYYVDEIRKLLGGDAE